MNTTPRRSITLIITLVVISLAAVNAGPKTHSLSEDAALDLLLRTLKHDQAYAKRISLDCVTFDTEEKRVHTFSSPCAKTTPQSAAAIPTPHRYSIATAFIARREKLNG